MTDLGTRTQRSFKWELVPAARSQWVGDNRYVGAELAAIRRGIGAEPGSVPEMWPFYTKLRSDGRIDRQLRAEHVALTLFAAHMQSQDRSMHRYGVGLGEALLAVRRSERHRDQPQSLDRRFATAATSTSLGELAWHLRALVSMLRDQGVGQDYTALYRDLCQFEDPVRRGAVRRRWGARYFDWTPASGEQDGVDTSAGPGAAATSTPSQGKE